MRRERFTILRRERIARLLRWRRKRTGMLSGSSDARDACDEWEAVTVVGGAKGQSQWFGLA